MKTYTLTLNETQAHVVKAALDLLTRIGLGQFEEVLQVYDHNAKLDVGRRILIRRDLNAAKAEAGHPANSSYGIHNEKVDDRYRVAYDIQQVIRHRLAWDRRPEGGMQVDFDKPVPIGGEPLAQIEPTETVRELIEDLLHFLPHPHSAHNNDMDRIIALKTKAETFLKE